MFDAKKTARELTKSSSLLGYIRLENEIAAALSQAKAGGIAEGWKQMMQAAAKVARERAEHHRGYCPTTCRCADGWHIAAAIESLPLEPQPLETKGTDNGG